MRLPESSDLLSVPQRERLREHDGILVGDLTIDVGYAIMLFKASYLKNDCGEKKRTFEGHIKVRNDVGH